MLLRILLKKFGLFRAKESQWDLFRGIEDRVEAYKEKNDIIINETIGPMITLHKLNKKEMTVNTAQIQSIESMGTNTLIIFSSGNRIIVMESVEQVNRLLKKHENNDIKKDKGD